MQYAIFLLVCISYVFADDYLVNPDGSRKEYDGIGIGLINRPNYCDRTIQKGDRVRMNFNCTLGDGYVIDSTYNKRPFEFVIGEKAMIPGFEGGILDMCEGEVRHLTVPSKWAYGDNAFGQFPPRTTLYFFIHVLSFEHVTNAPVKDNTFLNIDHDGDDQLSSDEVRSYLKNEKGVKDVDGVHGLRSMLHNIFEEEDRDRDGFITHPEFSGRKHTEL
ncbi:uncharacterized protein [Clytia hemisphaerica]